MLRELGELFAEAGHELYLVGGSVRDALLDRLSVPTRSGLHHRRPAGARAADRAPLGRRIVGHRHRVRHHRRHQGRAAGGDHHVPCGQLRPGVAKSSGAVRRHARRRSGAPRLHRQRHRRAHRPEGAGGARRILRSPKRFGGTAGRRVGHPCGAGGVVRRRSAAHAACCQVRLAARLHRRAAGPRGDGADGVRSSAASPPSGWPPNWTSWCWAPTRWRAST